MVLELTPGEAWTMHRIMYKAWQYIAADCIPFMDDPDDEEAIVELCYDAGRLYDHCEPEEKELVERFYEMLINVPDMYAFAIGVWNVKRPE
jgi:hypothetical protein